MQLHHLVLMRFLDGEEVVALLYPDVGQVSRATACVPTQEEQSPDRLFVTQALASRWSGRRCLVSDSLGAGRRCLVFDWREVF